MRSGDNQAVGTQGFPRATSSSEVAPSHSHALALSPECHASVNASPKFEVPVSVKVLVPS